MIRVKSHWYLLWVLSLLFVVAACDGERRRASGPFRVDIDRSQAGVPAVTITHRSDPGKVLWMSVPGEAFVAAASAEAEIIDNRASFTINDEILAACDIQTVDGVDRAGGVTTLTGRLVGDACDVGYSLRFVPESTDQLGFDLTLTDAGPEVNRLFLRYASSPDERFFGFGEQFTHLDMKGRRLEILSQEQGIGRGAEPLSTLLNIFSPGSSGTWQSTYAAVPHYITSLGRSLFLENYEVSVFDMEEPDRVEIKLFGRRMKGRILNGDTPLDLVEEYTAYTGRMDPLPDWLNEGAVVGIQGGTAEVYAKLALLQAQDTPVGAFWLQDWVGKRITVLGSQLWWNWVLDEDQYPGWDGMVEDLRGRGIRVMTYINPMLVDIEEERPGRRNLFREAEDEGYFVKNAEGGTYMITNTTFDAGLVDLTNPGARAWYKEVIRDEVYGVGASGWMADYAEALPFDAVLWSGEEGMVAHNRYPEDWAALNREVLAEEGVLDDAVFFMRSGYTKSPGLSPLFWVGDQLVTFDGDDGLKSAIKGMLSGGISGYSLNHSDIGGFTTISVLFVNVHRSKELLLRWMEANAFTSVFRTHEGSGPAENAQFYTDDETLAHFARFAKVFRALAFYRRELMVDAAGKGWPVARHPLLHYPEDSNVYGLKYQWMLGSELMVVPVVDENDDDVRAYLPAGEWVHIWTGDVYGGEAVGDWYDVESPLGRPAAFYKAGSAAGETFADNLRAEGLIEW